MEKNEKLKKARQENEEILSWLKAKDFINKEKEKVDEVQLLEKAGTYQIFWRTYFEKDLAKILDAQKQYMAENVETAEQLLWLRGVIAGIDIVKRYFEEQNNLAMDKFNVEKENIIQ
jgi:hypothetical protein